MAERNDEEIAAALHGLSAGDAGDTADGIHESHDQPAADANAYAAPPSAPRPASARPTAPGGPPRPAPAALAPKARGAGPAPATSATPRAARPPQPPAATPPPPPPSAAKRAAAPGPARPAAPEQPPAPPVRGASQPSSSGRPSAPARPTAPGASRPDESHLLTVDDLDDAGAAAQPSAANATPLGYRGPSAPRRRPAPPPFFKTIGFLRTSIPILLTTGVMMLVLALSRFVVDEASPMANVPMWTTVLLFIMCPLLLGLAVANMLRVKKELEPKAA